MNLRTVKIRTRPATARPGKYERPEEPRKARGRTALIVVGTLAGLTMDLACRPGAHTAPPPSAAVDATPATTAVPATPATTAVPASARAAPSLPAGVTGGEIVVRAKGKAWVSVTWQAEMVTVFAGEIPIVGRLRPDGTRTYSPAEGGPALLEVRPRPSDAGGSDGTSEGFELRGADGKLLWTVKAGPDNIKIAAEEGSTRAFAVSSKHAALATVQGRAGQALGTIRANLETTEITGEDGAGVELFRATTNLPARQLGVLLLGGVPLRERGVILAELAARAPARGPR